MYRIAEHNNGFLDYRRDENGEIIEYETRDQAQTFADMSNRAEMLKPRPHVHKVVPSIRA